MQAESSLVAKRSMATRKIRARITFGVQPASPGSLSTGARGDMLTGAMLEAQSPNRYAIGSALERIQGPQRLMLEEFRRQCAARRRCGSLAPRRPATACRTPNVRRGEADVIREKRFVPLEEFLRTGRSANDCRASRPTAPIRPALRRSRARRRAAGAGGPAGDTPRRRRKKTIPVSATKARRPAAARTRRHRAAHAAAGRPRAPATPPAADGRKSIRRLISNT